METMNCQECRKWWSPYLDSELDAHTTFQVAEHLRACPSCRERFEREAYFEDWLRTKLRRDHMPTDVWGALCDQVRGTRTSAGGTGSGAWRGRWALRGLALAAAVGLIVIGDCCIRSGNAEAAGTRKLRPYASCAASSRSPTFSKTAARR
jgi:predicted anti-sigma-YlaC factor YlaD